MKKTIDQIKDSKRPTVAFSNDEHKLIAHFCIDHDLKLGDFLKNAALYCVKNKINPVK
jgi:hypothetical protein